MTNPIEGDNPEELYEIINKEGGFGWHVSPLPSGGFELTFVSRGMNFTVLLWPDQLRGLAQTINKTLDQHLDASL